MWLGWGSAERAFEAKQHRWGAAQARACGAVLAFCLLPLSAHAAEERPSFLGWEAGRLDYAYGASEVAAFVNTFEKATDISSFSHGLDAWKDTESGRPIDYVANAGQVADAIERRMAR